MYFKKFILLIFSLLKTLMESIHAFSKNLNEGSTGFHIKIFKENHVLGLFPREERSLYWTSSTSLIWKRPIIMSLV